jgi:hypothetical protein
MEVAEELAKLSDFPVIIRPATEDPSAPATYVDQGFFSIYRQLSHRNA